MARLRLLVLKRRFSSGPAATCVTVYLVSISVYSKPWHICQFRSIGSLAYVLEQSSKHSVIPVHISGLTTECNICHYRLTKYERLFGDA